MPGWFASQPCCAHPLLPPAGAGMSGGWAGARAAILRLGRGGGWPARPPIDSFDSTPARSVALSASLPIFFSGGASRLPMPVPLFAVEVAWRPNMSSCHGRMPSTGYTSGALKGKGAQRCWATMHGAQVPTACAVPAASSARLPASSTARTGTSSKSRNGSAQQRGGRGRAVQGEPRGEAGGTALHQLSCWSRPPHQCLPSQPTHRRAAALRSQHCSQPCVAAGPCPRGRPCRRPAAWRPPRRPPPAAPAAAAAAAAGAAAPLPPAAAAAAGVGSQSGGLP